MAGHATATHRMPVAAAADAAAAVAVVIDVVAAIHTPLVQLAAPEVAPLLAFPEEEGALVGLALAPAALLPVLLHTVAGAAADTGTAGAAGTHTAVASAAAAAVRTPAAAAAAAAA